MADVIGTKITPSKWNKKYPLDDLKVGDKWAGSYAGAYQCVGFARMVLDATYGTGSTIPPRPDIGTFSSTNLAGMKNAFADIVPGDRVTLQRRGKTGVNDQHAIIVAAKGTDSITVYDCNYVSPDTIGYYTAKYSELVLRYDKIRGGVHHK